MNNSSEHPNLSGHRVLVPGGTGAVGEGIVRRYLAAGADVLVPTRSQERSDEFRALLGEIATEHLHLVVHDYTTFAGAQDLATQMVARLGGIDDVVAPIGGWWAGKRLWEIDEHDWQSAFVALATTHMAVARAAVPRLSAGGTYTVILGASATWPVPTSGLVSMEQAAVLMMHQVLVAELDGASRAFALVLGPVSTRAVTGESGWVTADQVGLIAAGLSADTAITGQAIRMTEPTEIAAALTLVTTAVPV
ncbi:SDR family oxidoreductase [Subtercola endophyticus]|uniref:SDR family oxidoreductase n=1 Tax=Subtercola endophyticus TaxID=2895559 RepID=UPI001E5332BA|nr:SDR family oxidoreductase [Subtercola endophyticus]UFS57541.1 SDR family oxidoreductase [Subtercola endophyticus]